MTKLAIFEYTSPGLKGMKFYITEDEAKFSSNKIRLSEYVDVEFPPRAAEEVVPEQIAALEVQIAEVTNKFSKAITELKARKSELLAITSQPEVVE
ncbi:MAG: hypothetical protein RB191_19815 [Terriglobia bacterium]|nr:hypothetical protein [Terriglobia bacterium]